VSDNAKQYVGSTVKNDEGGLWETIKVIIQALLIAVVVRTVLFQPFNIPSGSLIPTLLIGDYLFVSKYSYGYSKHSIPFSPPVFSGRLMGSEPKRGDIAVFKLPKDNSTDYIKRVIGLPGDKVKCCDAKGRITVNGKPLAEKDYIYPGDSPSLQDFTITVPEGRLWVMGDHRSASADSRAHLTDAGQGTIPIDHVVGRAFVVVWPLNRLAVLSRPGAFAEAGLAMGPSDAVPLAAAGLGLPLTAAFAMHRWRSRQPWRRRARRRG
jgi:signal peptidase I